MVDVADGQLIAKLRLKPQQKVQQRHAVCPAGHCRRQMQLMQRGTRGQQRFLQTVFPHPGKDRFVFHQRLKSTSIKRVWAPSQPSGTVLVSPWRFLATMHSAVSASTSAPSGFWLA